MWRGRSSFYALSKINGGLKNEQKTKIAKEELVAGTLIAMSEICIGGNRIDNR